MSQRYRLSDSSFIAAPGASFRISFFFPPNVDVGPVCVTPHPINSTSDQPNILVERVGKYAEYSLSFRNPTSPDYTFFAAPNDGLGYLVDIVSENGVTYFAVDIAWGF